jgi:hypothetical protein
VCVRTDPKSNRKIVETDKIDTPSIIQSKYRRNRGKIDTSNTHIHDRSLSYHGTSMTIAQWRQMRQMTHFWNGKCNLLKANKKKPKFSKFVFIHPLCLTLFRPGLRLWQANLIKIWSLIAPGCVAHMHDITKPAAIKDQILIRLGTSTSITSGRVKLVLWT